MWVPSFQGTHTLVHYDRYSLDLTNNAVVELPVDVLSGMTQLVELSIGRNKLYGHRTDTYNADVMTSELVAISDDGPSASEAFNKAAREVMQTNMGADLMLKARQVAFKAAHGRYATAGDEEAPKVAAIVDAVTIPGASKGATVEDYDRMLAMHRKQRARTEARAAGRDVDSIDDTETVDSSVG